MMSAMSMTGDMVSLTCQVMSLTCQVMSVICQVVSVMCQVMSVMCHQNSADFDDFEVNLPEKCQIEAIFLKCQ